MKKLSILFIGMTLLFCIRGQSQSIQPAVFNTAGGSYESPGTYNTFEWSLGELTLIDTYSASSANIIVTQGVLQPCTDLATKSPDISEFDVNEYRLFPNVTSGPFELDFFLNVPGKMELQLTDALGKVIEKRSFTYRCCDRIERYDITNLARGVYFINAVFTPEGIVAPDTEQIRRRSTFKIVKGGN